MPAAPSTAPVTVRLEKTANSALSELAEQTRQRLGQRCQDSADWTLLFDELGVELLGGADAPGHGVRAATRRLSRVSPRQPFARALGRQPRRIVDATAGLGEDALMMFALGHEVLVIERSPVACALLEGAALLGRFPFPVLFGDARELLGKLEPEVVYLDPMFPSKRRSSALPPKGPRYLAAVVGPDADAEQLLTVAQQVATDRVVVKRPDHAPSLTPAPRSRHEGKLVRYDVYAPVAPTEYEQTS
ncbi:MAG: hypothetical protein E2O56_01685 [Gammaproteobacteria bacterium]|nr:MAG: hypothetical protein E2O56_01685 [Gammaproteobacteria bacterium]